MIRRARTGFFLIFFLCAASAVLGQYAGPDKPSIVRVRVTDRETQIPALAAMDLDLAGIDAKAGTVDFVVDAEAIQKLRSAGFDPVIVWTSTATAVEALADYLDPTEIGQR